MPGVAPIIIKNATCRGVAQLGAHAKIVVAMPLCSWKTEKFPIVALPVVSTSPMRLVSCRVVLCQEVRDIVS
jgi:hypothetical protein